MATQNTLSKQGKLEAPREVKLIEIPNRVLKTEERINQITGQSYTVITKLAPIQFKGGRLKGSREAIKLRKAVQRMREGGTIVC